MSMVACGARNGYPSLLGGATSVCRLTLAFYCSAFPRSRGQRAQRARPQSRRPWHKQRKVRDWRVQYRDMVYTCPGTRVTLSEFPFAATAKPGCGRCADVPGSRGGRPGILHGTTASGTCCSPDFHEHTRTRTDAPTLKDHRWRYLRTKYLPSLPLFTVTFTSLERVATSSAAFAASMRG